MEQNYQLDPVVKEKKIKLKLPIIFLVVILVCLGLGYSLGKISAFSQMQLPNYYKETLAQEKLPQVFDNDLLKLVWSYIKSDYFKKDSLDAKKLYYGSIEGFVRGLGDPYTIFMDPEVTKEFDTDISSQFQGIGAEVSIKDGQLIVVAPLAGSPAEKAGLMAGDKIYAIDKTETSKLTIDQTVKLIRGVKGTKVILLIGREGIPAKEFTITRQVIDVPSVKWTFRPDGLAYVNVYSFYEDTSRLFNQFLKEVKDKKPKGIIVDLRNNPGGLLDQANYITSQWVATGKVMVTEKFSDGTENKYQSEGQPALANFPTVVLINGGSASGSEILAGALKDYGIAKLIGEKTFGKGSVQDLKHLPDGSSLKVTIAEWLTPNGNCINQKGIEPDVAVKYTAEDFQNKKDPQLDKAVEILKGK